MIVFEIEQLLQPRPIYLPDDIIPPLSPQLTEEGESSDMLQESSSCLSTTQHTHSNTQDSHSSLESNLTCSAKTTATSQLHNVLKHTFRCIKTVCSPAFKEQSQLNLVDLCQLQIYKVIKGLKSPTRSSLVPVFGVFSQSSFQKTKHLAPLLEKYCLKTLQEATTRVKHQICKRLLREDFETSWKGNKETFKQVKAYIQVLVWEVETGNFVQSRLSRKGREIMRSKVQQDEKQKELYECISL